MDIASAVLRSTWWRQRLQVFVAPLFMAAYVADPDVGVFPVGVSEPAILYFVRAAEALFIYAVVCAAIEMFDYLFSNMKINISFLEPKGVVFLFALPYGIIGLTGSYFDAAVFQSPSLWHVVAVAFALMMHQELELKRASGRRIT